MTVSIPPHTHWPSLCCHSTESAGQLVSVLSGQQMSEWRVGWRSGRMWALNFRNKRAPYQDCYTHWLLISPLSTHTQTTRGSQSVLKLSPFICTLILSSYHSLKLCVSVYPSYQQWLHFFVIIRPPLPSLRRCTRRECRINPLINVFRCINSSFISAKHLTFATGVVVKAAPQTCHKKISIL